MTWNVSLRPVTAADQDFVCALYASTRQQELAVTGWPQAQVDAFLLQQFQAQQQHYSRVYPQASHALIVVEEQPIGRLYLDQDSAQLRIVDIALLPDWCGRGIGGQLLRQLVKQASASGQAVRIHVERHNPALRLYQRLGFAVAEDKGVYLMLQRPP